MLRRLVAELGPRWSTITMLWPLAPPRSGASLKRRLGRLDGQTEPPLDDELQLVGALDGDDCTEEELHARACLLGMLHRYPLQAFSRSPARQTGCPASSRPPDYRN